MQCGANSCRRAVVQVSKSSQPSIWVGDDLCERAFTRFVTSIDKSHRRYGSHVPGPLESRRRLEKRRMGGATMIPQDTRREWFDFPDIDSWFRQRANDTNWIWQPPRAKRKSNGESMDAITREEAANRVGVNQDLVRAYEDQLRECEDLEAIRSHVLAAPRSIAQAKAWSKAAFTRLLAIHEVNLRETTTVQLYDIGELLYFLQSELDDPACRNFTALLKWLGSKASDDDVYTHIIAVLNDKLNLRTMKVEELVNVLREFRNIESHNVKAMMASSIFSNIEAALKDELTGIHLAFVTLLSSITPRSATMDMMLNLCSAPPASSAEETLSICADYLARWCSRPSLYAVEDAHRFSGWNLESGSAEPLWVERILTKTTQILVLMCTNNDAKKASLENWLGILDNGRYLDSARLCHTVFQAVAKHVPAKYVSSYFATLDDGRDSAMLLLNFWLLPQLSQEYTIPDELQAGASVTISRQDIEDRILARYNAKLSSYVLKTSQPIYQPHIDALLAIHACTGVLTDRMIHDTFSLLIASTTPKQVYTAWWNFVKHNIGTLPTATAVDLINHLTLHDHSGFGMKIWERHPRVPLSSVTKAFLSRLDLPRPNPYELFSMLNREDPIDAAVPLSDREHPENKLSPTRVHLIHLTAHKLANHKDLTPRAAYRRVWELYRYLDVRRARIGPLMSRALVHAGVTRYLATGKWLSTIRFRFILKVVQETEGLEVAAQLDALAFEWRNANRERRDQMISQLITPEEMIDDARQGVRNAVKQQQRERFVGRKWRRRGRASVVRMPVRERLEGVGYI